MGLFPLADCAEFAMSGAVKPSVVIFFVSLLGASVMRSEPLVPADREALLEQLEKIREASLQSIDARYRQAMAAYQAAAASNEAATEFYVKCVEKVEFEDQKKKNSEFRDWKRKEDDKLKSLAHAAALRVQLRWLIMTLQATSSKANRATLAKEAQDILGVVFEDLKKFKDYQQVLSQSSLGSVFAQAYKINGVKLEKWPMSPFPIGLVYDQLLLPPYRNVQGLESLRAGWMRRIQQEMEIKDAWTNVPEQMEKKIGMADALRPPEVERFREQAIPQLQWQMEMDLFRNGDESNAAMNMLRHIETHPTHESHQQWTEDLRKLLSPPTEGAHAENH